MNSKRDKWVRSWKKYIFKKWEERLRIEKNDEWQHFSTIHFERVCAFTKLFRIIFFSHQILFSNPYFVEQIPYFCTLISNTWFFWEYLEKINFQFSFVLNFFQYFIIIKINQKKKNNFFKKIFYRYSFNSMFCNSLKRNCWLHNSTQ